MLWRCASILKKIWTREEGNILIEISLSLPVLVLLLTTGFDLARHVLLLNKLDQFVAAQARNLIQREQLAEGDISSFRMQGLMVTGLREESTRFFLSAEGGDLLANGSYHSRWSAAASENDMACILSDRPTIAEPQNPDEYFPDYPLIIVSACFDAGAEYYLTPILPDSLRVLQVQAIDYGEMSGPVSGEG